MHGKIVGRGAGGCRFAATARLDRYAFGVTRGRAIIGRYVDVTVEVFATPTQC